MENPSPSNQEVALRVEPSRYASYSRGYGSYVNGYAEQMNTESGGEGESGGLIEYWRILRRRRGTLILITFVGLLAAILVTLPQTPVYRARTALEIQNVNSDFLNTKQFNPISEDATGVNTLTDVQTQMKIVQGESLVDQLVEKYKAANKLGPLQQEGRVSQLRQLLNLPAPAASDVDYRTQQNALKSLTVRQLGQTRVIEVLFDSTDPAFSANFLNDLTADYIQSNMDARWQMSQRTGEWLARQLDDMRVKLERSEDALEGYARRSGLLFTTPQNNNGNSDKINVAEEKLRQLQEELSRAQADRASTQSRYEIAKDASPDALADVINDASLRDLQAKITELRRQEAELISIYTPKHEKVRRVQAQIAPLETAFTKARASILDRIHNDYQAAQFREKLLQAEYADQSAVVTGQAEKAIQYNILKRELDSNRQIYESMLQQVKQASVAAAIRASNVRIVDKAKVPHKPYSPDYLLNSALGLLSGLLLGVAFVVMRERADRTLMEPGDLQFWINAPELGVIPSASVETSKRLYYARVKPAHSANGNGNGGQKAVLALGSRTQTPENKQGVELITWSDKPSMIAEAFRAVLTSIMFAGENGSRPRLLVLTSASPKEGKSTIVSNLAIALAEVRQRVLIVDADLRKPRMHDLFDLPNDKGLSTLLQVGSVADGALGDIIHPTAVPGLFVLPSGPTTHAAANLMYSPNLAELLTRFKKEFDMVLIDTPPMLHMTDARVTGRLADAVIFVARAGQTTREAAIAAHNRFTEDRIRVLGTILNDWDPKKSPNGYYGYHEGSYYGGLKYGGYQGYYAKK